MKILIAEDDPTSRMILRSVLTKSGHDVVEAPDGDAAWDILRGPDAPRLAIVDWMMPGLDGLELVRRVRQMPGSADNTKSDGQGRPYLIMLTARDHKDDLIAGLDAGADDYLTKPFDPGELRARVAVGQRMVALEDGFVLKVWKLSRALEEVKTLQGILPICSFCKKIRDDQGYWSQVEAYVTRHSGAQFSHSICPECMKEQYPELCRDEE